MTDTTTDQELAAAVASLPSFGWGGRGLGWSPVTEGYFRAAGRGELTVPRCSNCGTHRWPPTEICYSCYSRDWDWDVVPARGHVYSYTWSDHPVFPGLDNYNMTVIELDETVGERVRVLSQVLDASKDELEVGKPVVAVFEQVGAGLAVPLWRLAATS